MQASMVRPSHQSFAVLPRAAASQKPACQPGREQHNQSRATPILSAIMAPLQNTLQHNAPQRSAFAQQFSRATGRAPHRTAAPCKPGREQAINRNLGSKTPLQSTLHHNAPQRSRPWQQFSPPRSAHTTASPHPVPASRAVSQIDQSMIPFFRQRFTQQKTPQPAQHTPHDQHAAPSISVLLAALQHPASRAVSSSQFKCNRFRQQSTQQRPLPSAHQRAADPASVLLAALQPPASRAVSRNRAIKWQSIWAAIHTSKTPSINAPQPRRAADISPPCSPPTIAASASRAVSSGQRQFNWPSSMQSILTAIPPSKTPQTTYRSSAACRPIVPRAAHHNRHDLPAGP